MQRLITLLYTSHTGQCAPSLKWYKIHMVQPVPPVMLGFQGTPIGGEGSSGVSRSWQAQSSMEPGGGPGVLAPKGRDLAPGRVGGRRQPLHQGANGSHHVQCGHGDPGDATQGDRGLTGPMPAMLINKQPLSTWFCPQPCSSECRCAVLLHPSPSPGSKEQVFPPPSSTDRQETKDVLGGSAQMRRSQQVQG